MSLKQPHSRLKPTIKETEAEAHFQLSLLMDLQLITSFYGFFVVIGPFLH